MKKLAATLSLFTSTGTLICCALPALFVALGMGAAFAGLITQFPQLIWLSEHKTAVFFTGAVMLGVAGILQYQAREMECPIDPAQAEACRKVRGSSFWIFWASVVIFLIGTAFSFLLPLLME